MDELPRTSRLKLVADGAVLTAWLDDAATRNALSQAMRDDLLALVDLLENPCAFRALVLRGAGGTFCSGGDLKAFTAATQDAADAQALAADNRVFGHLLTRFNALPLATFALVEGAAYAGALGLLCATDVVIALDDARFAVSETSLGLVPAQIAPFMVQRIGLTQARRLALTGGRFDGAEAARLGFAQFRAADLPEAEALLGKLLAGTLRCAPGATAATKRLLAQSAAQPPSALLDSAAHVFASSLLGPEGLEGLAAFAEKRPPGWAL